VIEKIFIKKGMVKTEVIDAGLILCIEHVLDKLISYVCKAVKRVKIYKKRN